jgi:hypothetical protein
MFSLSLIVRKHGQKTGTTQPKSHGRNQDRAEALNKKVSDPCARGDL